MRKQEQRIIYLDHAATTPVDPQVVEAMLPYWTEHYGNPSAVHSLGRAALQALSHAREVIAGILHAYPDEIVFTGSGSEADNLALRGVFLARRTQGNHIVTSAIEHHAVSHTCQQLAEYYGAEVTYVGVDRYGRVDPAEVERAITPRTILVSIMYANNEVGTIEPITEIAHIAHTHGIPIHTDAVQAGGQLSLDVQALGVDLLSLSAHKFYGPKGIGLLYVRQKTPLLPSLTGGGQEGGRRAGTENVAFAVGMATALSLAYADREVRNARLIALRDRLIHGILSSVPGAELTGHPTARLPNSASFVIPGVTSDALLMHLDVLGICASAGSACTAGRLEPSHVLTAMGYPDELALGALRLTLGHGTTEDDVDAVVAALPHVVSSLRRLSGWAPDRPGQG